MIRAGSKGCLRGQSVPLDGTLWQQGVSPDAPLNRPGSDRGTHESSGVRKCAEVAFGPLAAPVLES